jgi:hypothetical protein
MKNKTGGVLLCAALCVAVFAALFASGCAGGPEKVADRLEDVQADSNAAAAVPAPGHEFDGPDTSASPGEAPSLARAWNLPSPDSFLFRIPQAPLDILGAGRVDARTLAAFLRRANPSVDSGFAERLAKAYIGEAAVEGVNSDVAFAQMCHETGFLKYGGLVKADMYNFCGLGSTGPGVPGHSFATPEIGVRAQIQHLKAYASTEPLSGELVDPRYHYVKYGSAPTIHGLSGTWAADKDYGRKLRTVLQRLYIFDYTFNRKAS